MSQFEFISHLRRCLAGLPEEEIDRAVEYYEDYFADAGENEEEVIKKLGSPEEIAENIRREISGKQEKTKEEEQGVFTERGFQTEKDRENYQEVDKFTQVSKCPNIYENKSGSSYSQNYNSEKQGNYYYDDRKERKKNRKFIATLLIIFGVIWLCVLILVVIIYSLFSVKRDHEEHNAFQEVFSEVEKAFDDELATEESDVVKTEDSEGNTVSGQADILPDQNIEGLKIDIAAGEVVIQEGTKFFAKITKNPGNTKIKSVVKNGIWKIEEKSNSLNLKGLKDLIKNMNKGGIRLVITVPEGFEAKDIEIEVDAGKVTVDSLVTEEAGFEVEAGTIEIESLVVTKEAEMEVGMGSINISSGNIKNLDLECDMGEMIYEGVLSGKNKIECNMGSVTMKLDNEASDYTFAMENSMGKISIDGEDYSGFSSSVAQWNGDTKIQLEVNMGSIQVKTGKGKK